MRESGSSSFGTQSSERQAKFLSRYRMAALEAHRSASIVARATPRRRDEPELRGLVAALGKADAFGAEGDFESALLLLKSIVGPLAEQARAQGGARNEDERRAAAMVARTLARSAFAKLYKLGRDVSKLAPLPRSTQRFAEAETMLAAAVYDEAEKAFRAAGEILESVVRESVAAECFGELAKRRGRLVDEIRRLPTRRFTQKQRENALTAIRRFDAAARAGDEALARSALEECRDFLDQRHADSTSVNRPAPPRSFFEDDEEQAEGRASFSPRLMAAAVVAWAAVGFGLWYTAGSRVTADGTPIVASVGSSMSGIAVAPVAAIEIRKSYPESRAPRVVADRRLRFAAEVEAGDPQTLEWELDGQSVAHGPHFVLESRVAAAPGLRAVALVGRRAGKPVTLEAWQVEIESPIRFDSLEPPASIVDASRGQVTVFRGEAAIEPPEPLAYSGRSTARRLRARRTVRSRFARTRSARSAWRFA